MRLLVVEDDPGMAALLVRGLRREGYAVDTAGTGVDAFPLLDGTGPDAFARTNYYEGQFSYDLYFRRLGPNAPIQYQLPTTIVPAAAP
jgi:CheY-like chemotaxis protein